MTDNNDNITRAERRTASRAALHNKEGQHLINTVDNLDQTGTPVTPHMRIAAGYARHARDAHNNQH